MNKFITTLSLGVLLFAGNYITLDNGKVIELKPDGTWQEVKVVKKGDETIAIKPDGTWEKVQASKIETANKLQKATDQQYKDSPLVKTLMGKWQGEGIAYAFTPEKVTFKQKVGHRLRTLTGKWSVDRVDEAKRVISLDIAQGAKLGFLSFGGELRKIRVVDENTIEDITDIYDGKIYRLHRVR